MLLSSLLAAACGSEPTEPDPDPDPSPHAEVNEVFLRTTEGAEVSRTRMIDERWDPAEITVLAGRTLDLRVVFLDFSNKEYTLDGNPNYSLRVDVEGAIAWEAAGAHGRIRAVSAGAGRIRFTVWHIDHPDFTSPWLTVAVPPAASAVARRLGE